jgi:hypothetical protein
MDNVLSKLISADFLNEESKAEITQLFTESIETMKVNLREEIEAEVKAQLVLEWTEQRDKLIESLDETLNTALDAELNELKDDIAQYTDLKVKYAQDLVEAKKELAQKTQADLDTLVDKLDSFLEDVLITEFDELREDLELAQQNDFGRKIFESFSNEYQKSFFSTDDLGKQVKTLESKLDKEKAITKRLTEDRAAHLREKEMTRVLANLTGDKAEQMTILLKTVETQKLDEMYNLYIGKILKESTDKQPIEKVIKDKIVESVNKPNNQRVVDGNKKEVTTIVESTLVQKTTDSEMNAIRRRAGISA